MAEGPIIASCILRCWSSELLFVLKKKKMRTIAIVSDVWVNEKGRVWGEAISKSPRHHPHCSAGDSWGLEARR